jgi:hypothetical protein
MIVRFYRAFMRKGAVRRPIGYYFLQSYMLDTDSFYDRSTRHQKDNDQRRNSIDSLVNKYRVFKCSRIRTFQWLLKSSLPEIHQSVDKARGEILKENGTQWRLSNIKDTWVTKIDFEQPPTVFFGTFSTQEKTGFGPEQQKESRSLSQDGT